MWKKADKVATFFHNISNNFLENWAWLSSISQKLISEQQYSLLSYYIVGVENSTKVTRESAL